MRALVEYFLDKSIFLNLLTALILVVGAFKAFTMNREAFPNINFDIVTVTTIYPGASAAEVEKLITKPIEDNLKSVDGIKEIRSGSIENRSGVIITIDPNTKNTQKVVDDIKSAVDRTEDLPEDAKKPLVQEITSGRTPVIEVNIGVKEQDGKPIITEKELHQKAKQLEELLLDIPEVGRVAKKGYRDTEMHVDLNPEAMNLLDLSPQQIINALKVKNISFPGGNSILGGREAAIRTVGEFDTPEEIGEVYIRSNDAGQGVRLKDAANVQEGFADKDYIEKVNGLHAIGLIIIKKEKGDAINLVKKVKEITDKFEKENKEKLTFAYVNDISKYIERRLDVLVSNGLQGFILVVGSLFFFLGWRISLMVALGLPLAVGMTMITLDWMGITLNLISMMGLIIVVGMLVDDAIVISENIYRYVEEGMEIKEACIRGTAEVVAPVTATITTTCAAFGPMFFVTGIFGKFIFSIPAVVIISLASSLFEGIFILPSHIHDVSKNVKHHVKEPGEETGWFLKLRDGLYRPTLNWCLNHAKLTILIFNLCFFFTIGLTVVFGRFKLFPGGIEIFMVRISAPVGMTLEQTERFAQVLEKEIAKLPKEEVENYVTRIGITQKDPNDPFTKRGKNYGMVMIYLTPDAERKRSTDEIVNDLRNKTLWMLSKEALAALREKEKVLAKGRIKKEADISQIPDTFDIPPEYKELEGLLSVLDFEKLQGGPPVGKPVAIEIRGDDFGVLQKIGEEFKAVMAKAPGVIDIGDDYYEGKDEIRVSINEKLAAQAGVTAQQIALAINSAFQGAVATTIKRADEEVDVRVRFPESYRNSIDSLNKIHVTNIQGYHIPISKLITYSKGPGIAAINHLDGKRLLTATANIDDTTTDPRKANIAIKNLAGNLMDKYPGYRVRYGGENKDTEESMASLGRAFMIAFLVIFMILASLFKSFVQPLIVVSAIPFSFMGVSIAFITHGHYFSFLSFIGIIGLSGIVVNDSIVLVDFANQVKAHNPKISTYDLLMQTGVTRLRPVLLTTITTVLGILPTAYGIGGADPFLMPMALAIGWGLAFATALTLIFVPVQYKLVYDFRSWFATHVLKRPSLEVDEFESEKPVENF